MCELSARRDLRELGAQRDLSELSARAQIECAKAYSIQFTTTTTMTTQWPLPFPASLGPPIWSSILPTNATSNRPTPSYTYQTTYYLLPPTITSPGHTSYTTHTINTDSIPPQHTSTPLSPTTYYPLTPTGPTPPYLLLNHLPVLPRLQHVPSCIKPLSKRNTTILHRHNIHTLCIACIILQ